MIPFWFIVITVLWLGFFVLEGFDFGVGILHAAVGGGEAGRRTAINAIGPLWDGNEVWLIVAIAAMFAAFPAWYATMLSGFYLVVVLLLAGLIVRGVAFEYRGKRDSVRWRRTWDGLMTAGSLIAPFLLGLSLADLVHGVPIGPGQQFTGTLGSLFTAYAMFTGLTVTAVCVLHGATFLALKTAGVVRERAGRIARAAGPPVALAVVAFAAWTHAASGKGVAAQPGRVPGRAGRPGRRVAGRWPARGLGLRRDDGHHGGYRADRIRRSVSEGHGVLGQPGFQPDRARHGVRAYSLIVMTVVAVVAAAVRAWLPVVVVLRVPPAAAARGVRGRARRARGRAAGGGAFAATAAAGATSAADPEPGSGRAATGTPADRLGRAASAAARRQERARRLDRARRRRTGRIRAEGFR